jgi:hypothetical protein
MTQNFFRFFNTNVNRFNYTAPFPIADGTTCLDKVSIGWYVFGRGLRLGDWLNSPAQSGSCPSTFTSQCDRNTQYIFQEQPSPSARSFRSLELFRIALNASSSSFNPICFRAEKTSNILSVYCDKLEANAYLIDDQPSFRNPCYIANCACNLCLFYSTIFLSLDK